MKRHSFIGRWFNEIEFPQAKQNQNGPATNLCISFFPGLSDGVKRVDKKLNIRTEKVKIHLAATFHFHFVTKFKMQKMLLMKLPLIAKNRVKQITMNGGQNNILAPTKNLEKLTISKADLSHLIGK